MTIINHRWKSGNNGPEQTAEGRSYTAELWVESDDPLDTGHAVINYLIAQGFVYGASYNVGNDDTSSGGPPTALFQIDRPQLAAGSATTWSVGLQYREVTPEFETPSGEPAASPATRRPVISTSFATRPETVTSAISRDGLLTDWPKNQRRRVTSSAGLPFVPPPEIDEHNLIVRITRPVLAVVINQGAFPTKRINSEPFTLSDRKTTLSVNRFELKFIGWTTEPRYEDGIDFVEVTFEGELKKGGWRLELFDRGRMSDECNKPVSDLPYDAAIRFIAPQTNLKDLEGVPVGQDVPLNGAGLPRDKCDEVDWFSKWSAYDEIDPRTYGFFGGIAY